MHRFLILAGIILVTACSAKLYSPQAKFSISSSKQNIMAARKVLHEIAIDYNLFFEDDSKKHPSGTFILIAEATRIDGLKIVLLGTSEVGEMTVAIHCHEECAEWKLIHNKVISRFRQQWVIIE